ncbi:ankyrin repeat domain-containing protein [Carboxylicivirga sediminis]|uniref:Ankyrin repeat domain-containing protein n=1 Tax=Carboxylicivirga sediminis TaxID=2006564 RepID=A0A941F876_9BACT|nr:ankyrin repeat domain-containing protein [Carboxylicivirga sediminis]MBR8537035.1 ankyrin repeat domain-containing protein [Carboxylicivirga sediminis]
MKKLVTLTSVALMIVSLACQSTGKKNKQEESQSVHKTAEQAVTESINMPAYFQAALEGDLDKVKAAIGSGIDINAMDENQHSALMLAAYNGHHHIVSVLLENGAEIDAVDGMNRTALMFASTGPFTQAVDVLIQAGANVNATDNEEQWTPVMMAASEGQLEVVKLLVANGADLSMVDVDGESSLDFAQSKGHQEVVAYIQSQQK